MSALGEYVHLKTENYLNYGTAHINEPQQMYVSIKERINDKINAIQAINLETINELEHRLLENRDEQVNSDKQKVENDSINKIEVLYEILASRTQSGVMKNFVNNGRNWRYGKDYSTLKERVLTKGEILKLKERMNNLRKEINKLNQKQRVSSKELESIVRKYNRLTKESMVVSDLKDTKSILGRLQNGLDKIYFNTCKAHIQGDFGENLVAICDDRIDGLAHEKVGEMLNELVIGGDRSDIYITRDQVHQDFQSYFFKDENQNEYKIGVTQDKVDAQIKINGEDLGVSVKSYSNAYRVTLQKDMNLFYTLTALNDFNNFGTHWMNLHAAAASNHNKVDADNTVKLEMAYEGLVTGNPLKRDSNATDTFVFIDQVRGKVLVKSTRDILNNEFQRFFFKPTIESIILQNRRAPNSAESRIANLLRQVHNCSIHLSLSVSNNI